MSSQTQGHSESKSYNYQAVPLLPPDEVMRLPEHQSLIMRTGHAPVKALQLIWYKAVNMKNLPCGQTKMPHQAIIHYPFIRQITPEQSINEAMET